MQSGNNVPREDEDDDLYDDGNFGSFPVSETLKSEGEARKGHMPNQSIDKLWISGLSKESLDFITLESVKSMGLESAKLMGLELAKESAKLISLELAKESAKLMVAEMAKFGLSIFSSHVQTRQPNISLLQSQEDLKNLDVKNVKDNSNVETRKRIGQ